MASTNEEVGRVFFLLSNILFLAPAGYCLWVAIKFKLYDRILHAYLAVFIGFASFVYHYCDNQDGMDFFHICILPRDQLYLADTVLSIATLASAFVYAPPKRHYWIRDLGIAFSLTIPIYFYLDNTALYIFIPILAVFLLLARWLLRLERPDSVENATPMKSSDYIIWWMPAIEGDWWYLFLALFFGLAGLIFYILDNYFDYAILHGLWHSCEAIALLFIFIWIDTMPLEPGVPESEKVQLWVAPSISYPSTYEPVNVMVEDIPLGELPMGSAVPI